MIVVLKRLIEKGIGIVSDVPVNLFSWFLMKIISSPVMLLVDYSSTDVFLFAYRFAASSFFYLCIVMQLAFHSHVLSMMWWPKAM